MKKDIHPEFFENAVISCACGAKYETGSTSEKIQVELCANCHPFYTGEQKIIDTARRVEKFEARMKRAQELANTGKKAKKAKKAEAEATTEAPATSKEAPAENSEDSK